MKQKHQKNYLFAWVILALCLALSLPYSVSASEEEVDLTKDKIQKDIMKLLGEKLKHEKKSFKKQKKNKKSQPRDSSPKWVVCQLFEDEETGTLAYGFRRDHHQESSEIKLQAGMVIYHYRHQRGKKWKRSHSRTIFKDGAACGAAGESGVQVTGQVTASHFAKGQNNGAIRQAIVHLRSSEENSPRVFSQDVVTDGAGKFTLSDVSPGNYHVCAAAEGYEVNCSEQAVKIEANTELDLISLQTKESKKKNRFLLQGNILTREGEAGAYLNATFGLDESSIVFVLKAKKKAFKESFLDSWDPSDGLHEKFQKKGYQLVRATRTNADGQYSFSNLKKGKYKVVSFFQKAASERNLTIDKKSEPFQSLDVSYDNQIPSGLIQFTNENPPPNAQVGVDILAGDADEQSLTFQYQISAGTLDETVPENPQVTWTLPSTEQVLSIHVLVNDGYGGYSYRSRTLETALPGNSEIIATPVSFTGSAVVYRENQDLLTNTETRELIFYGGGELDDPHNEIWSFDLDQGSFTKLDETLPIPLVGMKILNHGNQQYLVGGSDGSRLLQSVWLKEEGKDFSAFGFLSEGLAQVCTGVVNGKPAFAGGVGVNEKGEAAGMAGIIQFNPQAYRQIYTSIGEFPEARLGATCHIEQNRLTLIGGTVNGELTTRVTQLDFATQEWSELAPLPEARTWHSSLIYDQEILVVGGNNGVGASRKTLVYNRESNSWTNGPSLAHRVLFPTLFLDQGKLFVFGGVENVQSRRFYEMVEF